MSIDWSKPLELTDGTPVRLEAHKDRENPVFSNGPNGEPDEEGDYWIVREDGQPLRTIMLSLCVSAERGSCGFDDVPLVRNRD